MKFFNHYRSIVISDVPLGTSPAHFKKLIYFIKNSSCDKLILSGDIIKGWQSPKMDSLYKIHNKFIKTLLKISERDNTKIIFITGEEDLHHEDIVPFKFANFHFVNSYKLKSGKNTFYIGSGDISDLIQYKDLPLFSFQTLKYIFLLWINKSYNLYRLYQGKKYHSLLPKPNRTPQKKSIVNQCLETLRPGLIHLSSQEDCAGIIYGHQQYSGIHHWGDITFLCSGYWTETLTALVESNYSQWDIIDYDKVVQNKQEAIRHADMAEGLFPKKSIKKRSEKY